MASVNPGRRNIHTHSGTAIHVPPSPPPGLRHLRLYNEISKSSAKIAECRKTPVPRLLVGKQVGRHPLLPERREARSHTPESTQCPGGFCAGVETPAATTLSIPPVPHRQPHPETEQSSPERWPRPPLRATRVRVTDTGAGGGHVPGSEATVSCRSSGPAVMLQPCVGNGPPRQKVRSPRGPRGSPEATAPLATRGTARVAGS